MTPRIFVAEALGTALLVAVVIGSAIMAHALGAETGLLLLANALVASDIGAAYWFTSSTSFANPAMLLARMLSDTPAGIRPIDAPGFLVAQLLGGFAAAGVSAWLFGSPQGN